MKAKTCDHCGRAADNPSSIFDFDVQVFCCAECKDNWQRAHKELRDEQESNP